jgi:hypothetical protein
MEPTLFALAILMAAPLLLSVVGIFLDPRLITGAPAWVKPAKFAVSIAIYALSLAWVRPQITIWPRLIDLSAILTAYLLAGEWVVVAVQAARGVGSHFNVATRLDGILFGSMGIAIGVVWVASAVFALALWRQPFPDPSFPDKAMGTALRLGMLLTVIGSATGGAMTGPTSAQLAEARATGRLALAGAHTVGAPDGGPGLPGLNWSTRHGDLRVPHFLGLHGLQAMILLAWLLAGRYTEPTRVQLIWIAAASYAALYGLSLVQALQGIPVLRADWRAMGAWLGLTVAAVAVTFITTAGTSGAGTVK